MRPRICITGVVSPSVRRSVRPSVRLLVGWSVGHAFAFRPSRSNLGPCIRPCLDASLHFYKRSIGPSIRSSVGNASVKIMKETALSQMYDLVSSYLLPKDASLAARPCQKETEKKTFYLKR